MDLDAEDMANHPELHNLRARQAQLKFKANSKAMKQAVRQSRKNREKNEKREEEDAEEERLKAEHEEFLSVGQFLPAVGGAGDVEQVD